MNRHFYVFWLIATLLIGGCTARQQPHDANTDEASSAPTHDAADASAHEATDGQQTEEDHQRAAILNVLAFAPSRSEEHRALNTTRRPVDTLQFAGLTPTSHVIEVDPGDGWYSEIILPFVTHAGHYTAAFIGSESDATSARLRWLADIDTQPKPAFSDPDTVLYSPHTTLLGADETTDIVFSVDDVSTWVRQKTADTAFEAFYRVLKPGGSLVIVATPAARGVGLQEAVAGDTIPQAWLVVEAKNAGFQLIEVSMSSTEETVEKMRESAVAKDKASRDDTVQSTRDRMILKFRKPDR